MAGAKSTFTRENKIFLALLRQERETAGVTQVELAKRLGQTQIYVSRCERGDRRLDIVELRNFCRAMGIGFAEFTAKLDAVIEKTTSPKRSPNRRV